MEPSQRDQMTQYLEQLLAATRLNQIDWLEVNPSTYTWSNTETGGRINLQQLGALPRMSATGLEIYHNYVMQVLDNAGRPQLVLQGGEEKEHNEKLGSLFQEIRYTKTQRAIEFLGTMLPKI